MSESNCQTRPAYLPRHPSKTCPTNETAEQKLVALLETRRQPGNIGRGLVTAERAELDWPNCLRIERRIALTTKPGFQQALQLNVGALRPHCARPLLS
jgi:hypothetical protein